MKAIYMTTGGLTAINKAYLPATQAALENELNFLPMITDRTEMDNRRAELREVEIIFSTWGMLSLSEEELETYLPDLKAVFYAAGSVQSFARPFLNRNVRIFSAFAANAVPVAEYAVAQIILAGKGFYQASRLYRHAGHDAARRYITAMPGNYGETVGVIGAGMIGRLVIQMLKAYRLSVLVFDPFLDPLKAVELGVEKCNLETLFERSLVLSNHLANNEQTRGMLDYSLFNRMRSHATFINTGRGAQVVESGLVRALQEVPTRTAVLDVTLPEPVEAGHPFYTMPNVVLTPHIAGSINDEVARMGEYMAQEYTAFRTRGHMQYEVTLSMLATMA